MGQKPVPPVNIQALKQVLKWVHLPQNDTIGFHPRPCGAAPAVGLPRYDSGQYGMSCWHQGIPEGFTPPQLNCSSWGEVLGTLERVAGAKSGRNPAVMRAHFRCVCVCVIRLLTCSRTDSPLRAISRNERDPLWTRTIGRPTLEQASLVVSDVARQLLLLTAI